MSNPVQIKAQQKRRARERMLKQVSEVVVELQDPQAAKKKATQKAYRERVKELRKQQPGATSPNKMRIYLNAPIEYIAVIDEYMKGKPLLTRALVINRIIEAWVKAKSKEQSDGK